MKPETFTTEDGFKITVTVEKPETKPSEDWEPKPGDTVHLLIGTGEIGRSVWNGSDTQQGHLEMGNLSPTIEPLEKKRDYLLALNKVTKAIKKKNNGWVPDWSVFGEYKYLPYHVDKAEWNVTMYGAKQYAITYPYCKTREIAQEIIDEYQTELDVIRQFQF